MWNHLERMVWSSQSIDPFCGRDCRTSCSPSILLSTLWSRRNDSSPSSFARISKWWNVGLVVDHPRME